MRRAEMTMAGHQRAAFGAIVSLDNERGDRLTVHRRGPVIEAVRQACAFALEQDVTLRVVAISTPGSIWSDLQMRMPTPRNLGSAHIELPELNLLTRAGYRELAHPRIEGDSRHSATRKKETLGLL